MGKQIYQYLKEEFYYNELYDRFTIEECRRWEASGDRESGRELSKREQLKQDVNVKLAIPLSLYFIKGARYREKPETIRKWMARDRARDEKVANASEPKRIRCLGCSMLMDCKMRDLHTESDDKKEGVLFFFECPRCHKRQAHWENGEEWEQPPIPCSKCKANMKSASSRKGNIITTTYFCPGCGHEEADTLDMGEKKEEPIDLNFEADRRQYCLSDKEGMEYISSIDNLNQFTAWMKDQEDNRDVYEAVAKIEKLTIAELQKLLNPLIEQASYTKLEFGNPEMKRDVVVGFSLRDNKFGRIEHDSIRILQKLIKKALENTNWRLMSEGISYRLGFLNGRFRGIEGKEPLLDLIRKDPGKVETY